MTNPPDSFDWSSLGDEPLPGEMDDDALLEVALAQVDEVPGAGGPAAPRWVRPAAAAVILLAAAVLLALMTPSWRAALLGAEEPSTLAPDVEVPQQDDEAVRKHAPSKASSPPPLPSVSPVAGSLEAPPPEAAPEMVEPEMVEPVDPPRRKATPVPSADELLRAAQDALAAKDTKDALRKYSALVRHHPRSPQARAARVSLGRLQLSAGHGKKALAQFDRYLESSGGGLRREAELGRIDALRKLGRTEAEKRGIEAFLEAHPNTVHAGRLRKQLEALP
ncbi:MAG: tetratricopeptide repeat protein [Nannocystales bacterium]